MPAPECATCANSNCGGNDTGVPCDSFKPKLDDNIRKILEFVAYYDGLAATVHTGGNEYVCRCCRSPVTGWDDDAPIITHKPECVVELAKQELQPKNVKKTPAPTPSPADERFDTEEDMRHTAYRMIDSYAHEMNVAEYAAWSEVHEALCKLAGYYEDCCGKKIWKH